MAIQRTLVILKPDAVWMALQVAIKKRYLQAGLHIVTEREVRLTLRQASELYREHAAKPVFAGLILATASGPIEALEIMGENCIQRVRELNGHADPQVARPGTIRHDFKSAGGPYNMVHASDSPESAARELALAQTWV